ncbi:MAG TPA: universal stress protein [Cyclobacteriaceae bacterium]|nr:universal stress protein [Cyclobacteriaceae bacterium]
MPALKILLLTDFSPLSMVAMNYVAKMSHTLDVEFTLMNFVRLEGPPKSSMRLKQIEKQLHGVSMEEMEKVAAELKKIAKPGTKINFKAVRAHTVADSVRRYTEKNPVNLVVMGSKGASQLKKARLGGTTASVIGSSNYAPVLAIPEFAHFRNFKNVVYASDLKNVKKELELIIPYAKIFDSRLSIVHIVPEVDKKVEAVQKSVLELIKTFQHPVEFKLITADDIPSAIDKYMKEVKGDLLTTFTHELSLFDKLFARSVTRTLAYHANTPLLAFKRK